MTIVLYTKQSSRLMRVRPRAHSGLYRHGEPAQTIAVARFVVDPAKFELSITSTFPVAEKEFWERGHHPSQFSGRSNSKIKSPQICDVLVAPTSAKSIRAGFISAKMLMLAEFTRI